MSLLTLDALTPIFREAGLGCIGLMPLAACRLTRSYLLERTGLPTDRGSVILMALPYRTGDEAGANLSAYAIPPDYHRIAAECFAGLIPQLAARFPNARFAGFADHSPIDERHAAAKAGLGCIGDNGLLITAAYGSYVFLAELITDLDTDAMPGRITECLHCGACRRACPCGFDYTRCHSALTQKKGALTAEEEEAILRHGSAWGCDICQTVCPLNRDAAIAPHPAFTVGRIPHLTTAAVEAMDEAAFAERAYAWRGRAVILRNLRLLEKVRHG